MNIEYEITKIKNQLQNLQDIVLQMSRNSVPTTSKVDDTANRLSGTDGNVETNTANIDYLAMMTDVDLEEGE